MPNSHETLNSDLVNPNLVNPNLLDINQVGAQIDQKLSKRAIALDPAGYFIIYIDVNQNLIVAKHFTNNVNAKGLAIDPDTGEVISAKGKVSREPTKIFQGRTAKELCVAIFETYASNSDIKDFGNKGDESQSPLITMLDHAAYIGREAQKAERALFHNLEYIQD